MMLFEKAYYCLIANLTEPELKNIEDGEPDTSSQKSVPVETIEKAVGKIKYFFTQYFHDFSVL